jgi:Rrf2 family protein
MDKVVSSGEIASKMDIPAPFLGKIAQQLARSGFIEIVQGAKGGYRLLIAPEEIRLLDVIEAVTGEIFLNHCIMSPDSCRRRPTCAIHLVWKEARQELRKTLRKATFAKLLEEESCLRSCLQGGQS